MIFKGHLTMFYPNGAFARFLNRQNILLKDFKPYVETVSQKIKQHGEQLAIESGRPFRYLQSAMTAKNGQSKESLAQQIAVEDKVKEGLICVFSTLEYCSTFTVRGNHASHKLEVVRRRSKCLHFYLYYLDAELGFIHVRLQSWFPFQIQVVVNGRECLARYLDQQGIAYERYDNTFTQIDNMEAAQSFCEKFMHFEWPPVLNALANRVNPILDIIQSAGFGSYYWVADQCEITPDIMFKDRATLAAILPDLFEHAIIKTACENVLRFLGRKLHGNFRGEVTTDLKKRPEGWRVKHTSSRNSLKMVDKNSVLRVETTINNPSEFKICQQADDGKLRWVPMRKGVSNLYRYAEVGLQANQRYLEQNLKAKPFLSWMTCAGALAKMANALLVSTHFKTLTVICLQPSCPANLSLMASAITHCSDKLYTKPPTSDKEGKQRCTRISRLIAKLRGHGLIAKVKDARLYRITQLGSQVLFAVLSFYTTDFPNAFQSTL